MHIVRMWRMNPPPDARLTLISPFSRATYSGMLPGTLAGLYQPEEMEIDLWRFLGDSGVQLIVDSATGLDAVAQQVTFANRPPIRFDIASIGIGSVPARRDLWAAAEGVLSIKPMATFLPRLRARLDDVSNVGRPLEVAVIGAGAAGTEIAMCVNVYLKSHNHPAHVTLLDRGTQLLKGYSPKAVALVEQEFKRRDIATRFETEVEDYTAGKIKLADGSTFGADIVIWAASAAAPPELDGFQLTKSDDGFLAVRQTLQSVDNCPVFVVGDTATLVDQPVRKSGVYAVREGPVLWENIQRRLAGRQLMSYDPQKGFLSLLATGDGRAIADYKGTGFAGRWVWKWKDHIDRKFMRMYQDYRPTMVSTADTASNTNANELMRCRGCGGKVGASVLDRALRRLDLKPSKYSRQGLDQPDDAALLDPSQAVADVVTVDFFQAFLDDPYLVGRVAMLNALSDIWAMGAKPIGALAIAVLPHGPATKQAELLYQMLAGAVRELDEADACLLGGHTTEGSELTIGFNALGSLNGAEPLAKSGLSIGDQLILTKPLGTGTLLVGHAHHRCRAEWMDAMIQSMLVSNQNACRIAIDQQATAMTDVTGFGFAGHLLEMLEASQLSAKIQLNGIPTLEGFIDLAQQGMASTLAPSNREVESRIRCSIELSKNSKYGALFDPQTSGGLLIAAKPESASRLLADIRANGCRDAAIVGEVVPVEEKPSISID